MKTFVIGCVIFLVLAWATRYRQMERHLIRHVNPHEQFPIAQRPFSKDKVANEDTPF